MDLRHVAVPPAAPAARATPEDERSAALREKAVQMEAFLFAELLRASGAARPSPGGGETQFDSLLRQHQAEAVARAGRTGIAESIHRALVRAEAAPPPG